MYVTIPDPGTIAAPLAPLASSTPKPAEARLRPGAFLYYEGDEVDWLYQVTSGPVTLLCRPKCSFKLLSARRRRGFSSPVLSVSDADYRTR